MASHRVPVAGNRGAVLSVAGNREAVQRAGDRGEQVYQVIQTPLAASDVDLADSGSGARG